MIANCSIELSKTLLQELSVWLDSQCHRMNCCSRYRFEESFQSAPCIVFGNFTITYLIFRVLRLIIISQVNVFFSLDFFRNRIVILHVRDKALFEQGSGLVAIIRRRIEDASYPPFRRCQCDVYHQEWHLSMTHFAVKNGKLTSWKFQSERGDLSNFNDMSFFPMLFVFSILLNNRWWKLVIN
jgi:hypothetical protein